jgi:hypothetical protein
MANILAASMVCFPYVLVGLGQAIIVGTHSTGRTVRDAISTTDRTIPLRKFEERLKTSREEDTRDQVAFIPGCSVVTGR